MTVQIGVLNKKAVVLATDSAVTIQSGKNQQKIYNSVNKLFALSKKKPIAIMVYGNAELLGTPWETIVKVYRKQLENDYKSLNGYANNFLKWLKSNIDKIVPRKIQNSYFTGSIKSYYKFSIIDPALKKIKDLEKDPKKCGIDKEVVIKFVKQKISKALKDLEGEKYINNFNDQDFKTFLKKHKKEIDKIISENFQNIKLSNNEKTKLTKIACYIFLKNIFSDSYSGIVIAGFGDNEFYPSLTEFKIEGVFDNKIKYTKNDATDIKSDGCTAAIIPFAQKDVIHNFLLGIHPANIEYFKKIFNDYPSVISKSIKSINKKNKTDLEEKIKNKNQEIFDKFIKATREEFSKPIIEMISLMPITEMCEFAESLVNITSLRKKVTMQAETVGGETEVISITKGEGLIWIKRKQYFDSNLNPGFINNYLNI